jgi:hypothetical protein
MYVCMYVCMYVYTDVCMYIHVREGVGLSWGYNGSVSLGGTVYEALSY